MKIFKKSFAALLAAAMLICTIFGAVSSAAVTSNRAGDINGDSEVDNKDVVSLFRYLSGNMEESKVDLIACDVNGDGNNDNKDVTVLFRYLNGAAIEIFYGKDQPQSYEDNVYKVWDATTKGAFGNLKQTELSIVDEGVMLKAVNQNGQAKDPFAVFNIAKYARLTGKPELTGKDGAYIVLKLKSNADGYFEVFTHAPAAGDRASATYKSNNEFQYIIVDMTKTTFTKPEKLTTVRFDWGGGETGEGSTMIISEIGFFEKYEDALKYTKLNDSDVNKKAAGIINFPSGVELSEYITSTNSTLTKSTDGGSNTVLLKSSAKIPKITLNLKALADLENKAVYKGGYIALRYRVKNQSGLTVSLQSVVDAAGLLVTVTDQTTNADCSKDGWQGALFNIKKLSLYEDQIKKINVSFGSFKSVGSIEIGAVVVSDNINDALTVCEHTEYCLNYDSELTDNDTLADKVLVAENEDATLKMWFDQTTEKTVQSNTVSTGRTGYTVRMAKNESENCQFFLAPEKNINVRIEVEDFKNADGKTVPFEIFYEYYHNISNVLMPDAIPPLTGPVEIKAGNSQGFVIQLTTAQDTPAGLYESIIHIYDVDSNKEIKRAAVAVKVWDFALSEETELRTAFALWGSYVLDSYNWNNVEFSDVEVMDNYFEFFLKYRINIMDEPHGLTSGHGKKYMSQARVNTARWNNLDMSIAEDNEGVTPDWIDKVIYYPGDLDEPRADWQFALFKSITDRIKSNTPDYRMVIPFERDCDLTANGEITTFENASVDSIEFMKDYVNIWCPITYSFTTRDLGFMSNLVYLQSEEQDAKYGTFMERMKKEVEGGDELWAYVCINPRAPYANWKVDTDGVEPIVSLWQMKEYGVTGMLYWSVDYWKVNYWDQNTPWAFPNDGDGMLIYSGYKFGLPTPVSTLRLEGVRDGIEDYQMLCMLEDALGEEAANEMISRITTSVVTYANDDDYIHAVRVLLGDTLEEALNK